MSGRLMGLFIFLCIYLLFSIFSYFRLRQWYRKKTYWKKIKWSFIFTELVVLGGLVFVFYRFRHPLGFPSATQNWLMGASFSVLIGRLIFGLIIVFDGVLGFPFWGIRAIQKKTTTYNATRRKFVKNTGITLAGIPFVSLINGITFGKYNYQVRKVTLKYANLPSAFDGFSIAQLSDIHSGSLDDIEAVKKGVKMVNDLNPDLIAFTGDLVNNKTTEAIPFIDVFSKLKAPFGVYSTKGNHDYGLYRKWNNSFDLEKDQKMMDKVHAKMGFKLLKNEHVILNKNDEEIQLIGVENWGKTPFPQIGDINKAVGKVNNRFKILLSHDPSHWDEKVRPYKQKIDLTLSGHTHGMQFGVEIPGFIKWSPVKYRYPRWAGLYKENSEYLYVNRGFGFIGFPGRVGIMPEITLITLEKA